MSNPLLPWFFDRAVFLQLNPDVPSSEDDGDELLASQALAQGRLCSRGQLVAAAGEFGAEVVLQLPYIHYLWRAGLFFDHVLTVYEGMEPFYFFLPPLQLATLPRGRPRFYRLPQDRELYEPDEFVRRFDERFWDPPPLRDRYAAWPLPCVQRAEKPLLLIQNKYNVEWDDRPCNFFPLDALVELCRCLRERFQLAYLRPSQALKTYKKFAWDYNSLLEYEDFDVLRRDVPDVWLFDELLSAEEDYNLQKLRLLASCDFAVSVQGGGAHLLPYFCTRLLMYHVKGTESQCGAYEDDGWYKQLARRSQNTDRAPFGENENASLRELQLRVVTSPEELLAEAPRFFAAQ